MLVHVIKSQRYVVSICDTELLGKKFEEGQLQIDVKESFFSGDEMNEEEAILIINKMIREDATFYIVGQESVNTAIRAGIIQDEDVKTIENVPVALILL